MTQFIVQILLKCYIVSMNGKILIPSLSFWTILNLRSQEDGIELSVAQAAQQAKAL